jgi:F-type H+-transporting ATPase subunit b
MLADNFTIIAQVINFLILVLLLRRFLYGPVVRAMNDRQARIAAQVAEAEILKQQAVEEAEAYRRQREGLENRRDEIMFEAKEEAEAWRREYLNKARHEVEEARASWHKGILAERQGILQEARREIGRQVYGISRRALADLADSELEQQTLRVFLRQVEELDDDQLRTLMEAIQELQYHVILRSAYEISPADRQRIREGLRRAIAPALRITFELDPDLLCGVELRLLDHKLAWTLDEYLDTLEEDFFDVLADQMDKEYVG